MGRYGYRLIDTPIIEPADLFLTKAGDKVAERLFSFERHGQRLALRPEFTATAAHLYTLQPHQSIVRWQFYGSIFEDNHTDQGHRYQQYSAGAELIGLPGIQAEAEVISMATQGITSLGIDDYELVIGHVGLTRDLLTQFHLDPNTERFILGQRGSLRDASAGKRKVISMLARYLPQNRANGSNGHMTEGGAEEILNSLISTSRGGATMGGRTRTDIARRLLKKHEQAGQSAQIDDAIKFLETWTNIDSTPDQAFDQIARLAHKSDSAQTILKSWQEVLKLLEAYNVSSENIRIVPDLARTWDYYTGIVFEIRTEAGDALAGGGRYDDLTRLVGGSENVPAVGFAYNLDALMQEIPASVEGQPSLLYFLADDDQMLNAVRWVDSLRKRGLCVVLTSERQSADPAIELRLDADGNVLLGERAYSPQEIDILTVTLNGK